MSKLKMKSKNLVNQNVEKIASLFPSCVTEGKDERGQIIKLVDFDLLKQELCKDIVEGNDERYTLNWAGKKQAMLTANLPINATLRPCKEESVNFDNTKNLYIEGDNLDVLKILRETYLNKVKMIYIDPPYNTGNDFVYEDDFATSSEDYFLLSKSYDKQGNKMFQNNDSNGRFHSDWLSMMYSRLRLAKDLLTEDGVIFISIDENEIANLKKLCDEIFGSKNYVNTFCWLNNLKGRQISNTGAVKTFEYILCYAKKYDNVILFRGNVNYLKRIMPSTYKGFNYVAKKDNIGEYVIKNELYNTNSLFNEETRPNLVFCIHYNQKTKEIKFSDPKETTEFVGFVKIMPKTNNDGIHKYKAWRWSKQKILKEYYDLEFVPNGDSYKVYTKIRDFHLTNIKDLITEIGNGNSEMESLFGTSSYFSFPKSKMLIELFLLCVNDKDAIILDFFSGSSTTADAVMQLNSEDNGNRKFIMIQLPEKYEETSEAYKAGYKNICEIGKERIRRAGKKIKEEYTGTKELDIGFRVLKLDSSCMKDVYYNPADISQNLLAELEDNIKEERTPEDLLFQVMIDMGVSLSSEIKTVHIGGKKVFSVNDGNLICCFDKHISNEIVKQIAKIKPLYAVFRDNSIATDSVNANFDQIFKTYSPTTIRKVL